ncbi:MAG: protein-glutamate O-methyltransferase CheR [Gammaproteobacteria bacterium]|nr:protein-glutamate O-methyltransferase CheR [Gammaproteobacteria bacterium]
MSLRANDFNYVRELVRAQSANILSEGQMYLVESRLSSLARAEGLRSLDELFSKLRTPASPLRAKVVDAMTTNETSFFRDRHPFDALRDKILPGLVAGRRNEPIRIWSAACSSGQEPYSIAMLISERYGDLKGFEIFASDISPSMVARAARGEYSQLEVNRGLPANFLQKYFVREGMRWKVKDALRKVIRFRNMNLVEAWPAFPPVDVIFMRNVLIYLDIETRREILRKVRGRLKPNGVLFLGGQETTMNVDNAFEKVDFVRAGCFKVRR